MLTGKQLKHSSWIASEQLLEGRNTLREFLVGKYIQVLFPDYLHHVSSTSYIAVMELIGDSNVVIVRLILNLIFIIFVVTTMA